MTPKAAEHIGNGLAWFGFWIAVAVVSYAAISNGWRPWE